MGGYGTALGQNKNKSFLELKTKSHTLTINIKLFKSWNHEHVSLEARPWTIAIVRYIRDGSKLLNHVIYEAMPLLSLIELQIFNCLTCFTSDIYTIFNLLLTTL